MNIFPLSEGTFTVDNSKIFVPFDEKKEKLISRPAGSLLVEIQPFAVITSKDILLLDTGLGLSDEMGVLQLHHNLLFAGINPSSVTKVLLTHLHKDHAGGAVKLSFPGARYYLQQRELDYAVENGLPSFVPEELEVLRNSSQVVLLKNDTGIIDDYIHFEVTGAHSPWHQVFWIKENNETVFFGGDDAPHLMQMKHRYIAKYDYNGKKAALLRQQWRNQGEKEEWNFLFYHDAKNPVWKFK